jgi:hypothetical protein
VNPNAVTRAITPGCWGSQACPNFADYKRIWKEWWREENMEHDERKFSLVVKIRAISKLIAISSFFVFILFILSDYYEISRLYEIPQVKIFENIEFQVSGAANAPEARIVLYSDGIRKFSSSCRGLEGIICDKKEFWKKSSVKFVQAIEISKDKGIIKEIVISGAPASLEFVNPMVDVYVDNFSKELFKKDWISLFASLISGITFFVSAHFNRNNQKREVNHGKS